MSRKIISISLPPEIHAFVERRVEALGCGSTSEYFRELIRRDKRVEEIQIAERRRQADAALHTQDRYRRRY